MKPYVLFLLLFINGLVWAQYPSADEYESEYAESDLPYVEILRVTSFADLTREARDSKKVILLEMSASYCGYCKTLEEFIIKPMLRSGDYSQNVLIRKLDIDSYAPMKDLSGKKSSPSRIANALNVSLTPTLLFLDGNGNEVSERIVGVNTLEFYGAYVDDALEQGHRLINNRD